MAPWSRILRFSKKFYGAFHKPNTQAFNMLMARRTFCALAPSSHLNLPFHPNLGEMNEKGDPNILFYKVGMGYAATLHARSKEERLPSKSSFKDMAEHFEDLHRQFVVFLLEFDVSRRESFKITIRQYLLSFMLTPSVQVPHMCMWMREMGLVVTRNFNHPSIVATKFMPIGRVPASVAANSSSDYLLAYFDASLAVWTVQDGSVKGSASGGFVIYSAGGCFDDAKCYVLDLPLEPWLRDPTRMEMESLVRLAKYLSKKNDKGKNRKVKIFGDSSKVIAICTGLIELPKGYFNLYRDVCLAIKEFDEVVFQHVYREGNQPAHLLADLGRVYGDTLTKEDIKLELGDKLDCSMKPSFRTSIIQRQKEGKKQK